jgi:uncharacterized protein
MLLFIIMCFITPVYAYLYWRLGTGVADGILIALPLILIATFPFKNIHRTQRQLIYLSLGVVTYLTLMTVVRDLIQQFSGLALQPLWVFLSTFFLVLGGTLHAYFGPHVKKVHIPIVGLPKDLQGFKIAQISDLHVGPSIGRKYVEKVLRRTNRLNADVIVFTGDIGDGPTRIYGSELAAFKDLTPRYGSFYVTGNHEHYWGAADWEDVMTELGVKVLHNSSSVVTVGQSIVQVAGLPDSVSRSPHDFPALRGSADFKLLLSHRPGVARIAAEEGFHLQLSGHTHGGQFFPWTIVVRFVHEFHKGLERINGMWVYVNAGTGSWGPFLRIGTSTEITLLELGALIEK